MRRAITLFSARRPAASRRQAGAALVCLALAIWPSPLPAQQEKPEKSPSEKLEPVKTSITVTGQIAIEAPSNISVLDRDRIAETPGAELDDRLRTVPGFSLFRRTCPSLSGVGATRCSG